MEIIVDKHVATHAETEALERKAEAAVVRAFVREGVYSGSFGQSQLVIAESKAGTSSKGC